jgi:Co/Zn/Cd efflux system component
LNGALLTMLIANTALFGWLSMDALAGIVGAYVMASWSYGLVRDTGAILLDMTSDRDVLRAFAKLSKERATDWQISTCGG